MSGETSRRCLPTWLEMGRDMAGGVVGCGPRCLAAVRLSSLAFAGCRASLWRSRTSVPAVSRESATCLGRIRMRCCQSAPRVLRAVGCGVARGFECLPGSCRTSCKRAGGMLATRQKKTGPLRARPVLHPWWYLRGLVLGGYAAPSVPPPSLDAGGRFLKRAPSCCRMGSRPWRAPYSAMSL